MVKSKMENSDIRTISSKTTIKAKNKRFLSPSQIQKGLADAKISIGSRDDNLFKT